MYVIFLDFDGVLDTFHYRTEKDIEEKIKILSEICKEYNCKVVIEASAKIAIDEDTMEIDEDCNWVKNIFKCFDKYGIECIGRTPDVKRYDGSSGYIPMWKEDEIRLYLFRHPEIEHYCVIDDDDLFRLYGYSDLNKVRNHLVRTEDYLGWMPKREGLLISHKEKVGKALKEKNELQKIAIKRKMRQKGE